MCSALHWLLVPAPAGFVRLSVRNTTASKNNSSEGNGNKQYLEEHSVLIKGSHN